MAVDVTYVIQTVCRPQLLRAVRSIVDQDYEGAIDVLIGVDADEFGAYPGLRAAIDALQRPGCAVHWLDVGYSTSARRGGVHSNAFGGSLRSVLSFLARSRYVTYLDDDDWLHPEHTRRLVEAIQGRKWAFTLCWYAVSQTQTPLCVDRLESVGPGEGCYRERGGFVRPSALMLDKLELAYLLHLWSVSPFKEGFGQDRVVFAALKRVPGHGATNTPTVYYSLDPADSMHGRRLAFIRAQGVEPVIPSREDSMHHIRRGG
jgi:hypothetical protein